jgi:hypothetical protein
MIICILLAICCSYCLLKKDYLLSLPKERILLAALIVMISLVSLTIYCTDRIYTNEVYTIQYKVSDTKIKADKKDMVFETPKGKYRVDKNQVVKYEYRGDDPDGKMVELHIEERHYKPLCPDFLYALYYLQAPERETTIIVTSAAYNE